jgi:hypothetical protein
MLYRLLKLITGENALMVIPWERKAAFYRIRELLKEAIIMPSHQIICLECAKRPLGQYPGEWSNRKQGVAREDFLCDTCGVEIPTGTPCVAQSFGLDRTPYAPWEGQYIALKEGK